MEMQRINLKLFLLIVGFLLVSISSFAQKDYTYILANGDSITSKRFALDIKDRRIQHFVVNDRKIKPYDVKYFYKGYNYFKIERMNEKVKRNIFKRYQKGKRISIYYKSKFVVEQSVSPKKITKKQFYYEKDNGLLRPFTYESLRLDLNGHPESERTLKKVEKMQKIRWIAMGIAGGVLIYEGFRLNAQKKIDAFIAAPLVLCTFVIDSHNREERLLREAALKY